MTCQLCKIINEDYRIIKITKHSFSVICKSPIKDGHLMVIPKKCVTQEHFSDLSPEESHDLLSLIEEMQNNLIKTYKTDVILIKNSGSLSTQTHLHFHLIPSNACTRSLFSKYFQVPKRQDILKEEYVKMREKITENL